MARILGSDAVFHDPAAALFALARPAGGEMREMVVCPSRETSWS